MSELRNRILVVDDEKDVCMVLKLLLEEYGFLVDSFTDPRMALDSFKPNFYDLVILDIRMPELNSFELYDQLKSKDKNIKTLFFTALSSVEPFITQNYEVYPKIGSRHFLRKPVSNNDLLEEIYYIMN